MKKLVLLAIVLSLVASVGCAKKKVEPAPVQVVVADQNVDKVLTPMQRYEQDYNNLPGMHTVTKGECLWWISEFKQIYNDPFMWPLIYKANKSQIKNPDLIYPGQSFTVPRAFTLEEVQDSRKMAGAPWKMLQPGADAVVPAQMRSALGYSF
ncbi:MAG: LysM peptidoglycan-binding domain-containing protein [Proteobacteria bacterium]|nr:LysM peptidoglycan-binding domain-containing protein [Pseudomonadota bacterium]